VPLRTLEMNSRIVFNNKIETGYGFTYPKFSEIERRELLADIFEQILLFDKIVIKTGRLNYTLFFLINELGINLVEELIEKGYIMFLLWTPMIFTGRGRQLENGTIDESTIIGQTPIASGELSKEDKDPEKNIHNALEKFQLHRDRKKIFTKRAIKNYIVPSGMEFSSNSAKLVIDAYKTNCLKNLGLSNEISPENLPLSKRRDLLELGSSVIETAIMSKYELKGYFDSNHQQITKSNYKNLGSALKVTENTTTILQLKNIPNLRELFLKENIDFKTALSLRNLSSAKYYRKWINEISQNENAIPIATEYINEIKGNSKFFEKNSGKFIRNIGIAGASAALGTAIAGTGGAVAGLTLGLLDTFWFDSIFKGKNPSMFIEDIKNEVKTNAIINEQ
jgi:hypothetical protein